MPEEINRLITDAISDLLFVSEQSGLDNLMKEGVPQERIHYVGNVMIDSLVHFLTRADQQDIAQIINANKIKSTSTIHEATLNFALMTMHRPSNVDNLEGLQNICQIIKGVSENLTVIFALHPRTQANLIKLGLYDALLQEENLVLTGPLGYLEFLKLVKEANVVITDSGGIQEETTYLKVPCITFRSSTERPVTITEGTNHLVPNLDVSTTLDLVHKVVKDDQAHEKEPPTHWDGKTAERILKVLQKVEEAAIS